MREPPDLAEEVLAVILLILLGLLAWISFYI